MLTRSMLIYRLSSPIFMYRRGLFKLYFKMHMRSCSAPGGSHLRNLFALRNLVTNLDEIAIIVSVQHLAAVSRLNNDGISIGAFRAAFDHPAGRNSPNRRTERRCDIRSGMVFHFAV